MDVMLLLESKVTKNAGVAIPPHPQNAEYVPYCLTNSSATAHIRSQRARVLCVFRHIHIYYKERRYALSVPPLQCRGRCPHRPILLLDKFKFSYQYYIKHLLFIQRRPRQIFLPGTLHFLVFCCKTAFIIWPV